MKHLTLIRHAKSSWGDASLPDFERPLGERGLKDAPRVGAYLQARQFPPPDRIVSSPALRAITTARIMAEALGSDRESIVLDERIYEASLGSLYSIIREFEDAAAHLILVGHNPGFERLAYALDPSFEGDGEKYPTCGVAHMELEIEHWAEVSGGCTSKSEFIYPKMLCY